MIQIRRSHDIEIECIHPRSWNPNVMSDDKFNQLCDKIQEEDFTDPLKVYPATENDIKREGWDETKKHYWIWAGEHRWRYARVYQMLAVPCIIYDDKDWDEAAQKMKMVRDNLVHGELDAKKFTELAKSIDSGFDIDPKLFGFTDQTEMERYLIKEKSAKEKSFLEGFLESANRQKEAVDSLSDIVSNIFQQCAGTVDQSYLHFTHRGNIHCVVLCESGTKKEVERMLTHLQTTGENINVFMEEALKLELARVKD